MNGLIKNDIDKLVDLVICGEIDNNNYTQALKCFENLKRSEKNEVNMKIYERLDEFNNRLEMDRLKIARKYKKIYEATAKEIFGNVNSATLGEIYETSKCIDLKLTSGVYFLRNLDNGSIKIGYGKDLLQRITQIARAFKHIGYDDNLKLEAIHLCFEPHLGLTESFFHNEFRDKRVKGEWFEISNEDLLDYFLMTGFEGEFIDDVLVSWTDYESLFFEPLKKDYEIDIREMEYELFQETLTMVGNGYLFRHGVRNKLYEIIRVVEDNKVGINAVDFSRFPDIKNVGITAEGATIKFDFSTLKYHKYNSKKIEAIIKVINNTLS